MSLSEQLTIVIFYHFSGYKNFKYFYKFFVEKRPDLFPKTLSYNRFIELMPRLTTPPLSLCTYLRVRKMVHILLFQQNCRFVTINAQGVIEFLKDWQSLENHHMVGLWVLNYI